MCFSGQTLNCSRRGADGENLNRTRRVKVPLLIIYYFSCYIFFMSVTQTVEVPVSHRLTINVPREIPAGRTIIAFTPIQSTDTAKPDRKPISKYFGILSQSTYGDGVAYQRNLRNEWDD